jgi:hypothetical protein
VSESGLADHFLSAAASEERAEPEQEEDEGDGEDDERPPPRMSFDPAGHPWRPALYDQLPPPFRKRSATALRSWLTLRF